MSNATPDQADKMNERLFIEMFTIIQNKAHSTAVEKGFHNLLSRLKDDLGPKDYTEVKDIFIIKQLGLMCEEIGEAMSAVRHHNANDDKLTNRLGIEVEMADCIIRIMDLAGLLKLDVAGAIIEKMAFNDKRPYLHGKTS